MMSVCSSPSRRLLLDHRVDRDLAIGEDARDVGQHARPVLHAHAQVVAGLHVAHRQDRQVGKLVGLEREMRHAVLGIGGVHARDVDQVGDHRARGRLGAGARAVVQRRRRPRRPSPAPRSSRLRRWRSAASPGSASDARAARCPRRSPRARDAEQLDAVAELLGVADVLARELARCLRRTPCRTASARRRRSPT